MKNRTLIVAALVMVLLCVGLIFLGLRHENAGGGSPGQSQTTDGDTQSQPKRPLPVHEQRTFVLCIIRYPA